MFNLFKKEEKSDSFYLEKIRDWKVDYFEYLYERYNKKIYNYLLNILNYNTEDANQLLWDVFIKVFQYIKDKEVNNFNAFIYRISHNIAIDYIKWNKSYNGEYLNEEYIWEYNDTTEEINISYEKEILLKAIDKLDVNIKSVLLLHYFEWKDYNEINEITWISQKNIWNLIFKWKKRIKELVDKNVFN